MEGLIFIAVIAFGVWHYWGRRQLQINRATQALQRMPGYSGMLYIVGANGETIALDPSTRKVVFVDRNGKSLMYDFSNIITVEACKNGALVTKTNRGSQIITAAVGQLLFGEKGFEVGGLTGSTTMSEHVTSLSIKIYLSDLGRPMREISIYKGPGIKMQSKKFAKYAAILDEWYGRIRSVIANP